MTTAFPMFLFFSNNPIRIVYMDGVEPVFEDAYMCLTMEKENLMLYYILMAMFIFLPIIVIFIWFYYKIATIIWRHRKPSVIKYNKNSKPGCAPIATDGKRKVCENCHKFNPKSIIKKTKNVQMERKNSYF
ncbi:hypothetical protein NQ314_006204 [Rhamnusium bicolor]|uniref:G-protein coupled receptors family 1 profile domain-containing protein n=1 Tax=Rhamnusium bicolor TaxID=1586634 RepID=A0AAV8Z8M4_9CUCU|nr:hypothetical protein NQ314_006204 [Rhamnusium bicolor]